MGDFTLTLYENGFFSYCEGMASSYIGMGAWTQEGDSITLIDNEMADYTRINRFRVDGDDLVFLAEDSSNFIYVKVQDGERFSYTGKVSQAKNGGADDPEKIVLSWN